MHADKLHYILPRGVVMRKSVNIFSRKYIALFRCGLLINLLQGANVNLCDGQGHTPLDLAMADNYKDVIDVLQRYGAISRIPAKSRAVAFPAAFLVSESSEPRPEEDEQLTKGIFLRFGHRNCCNHSRAAADKALLSRYKETSRKLAELERKVAEQVAVCCVRFSLLCGF